MHTCKSDPESDREELHECTRCCLRDISRNWPYTTFGFLNYASIICRCLGVSTSVLGKQVVLKTQTRPLCSVIYLLGKLLYLFNRGERRSSRRALKWPFFSSFFFKLYSCASHSCAPSKSFSLINQAGGPHLRNEFIDTVITVITGDCPARAGIPSPRCRLSNGLMAPVMSPCIPAARRPPGCRSWRRLVKFIQRWPAATTAEHVEGKEVMEEEVEVVEK